MTHILTMVLIPTCIHYVVHDIHARSSPNGHNLTACANPSNFLNFVINHIFPVPDVLERTVFSIRKRKQTLRTAQAPRGRVQWLEQDAESSEKSAKNTKKMEQFKKKEKKRENGPLQN